VPVSVPGSRLSLLSVTVRDMLVSESRPPRKSLLLSALPSSLPSSPFSLSVVGTGVPPLESHTLLLLRSLESAAPLLSEYTSLYPMSSCTRTSQRIIIVDSCPPWNRPGRLPCRQASSPARWCPGRLHRLLRIYQDPREHPQGYLLCRRKHLRFLDAQPLEGDQAAEESSRGVRRPVEEQGEVLNDFIKMGMGSFDSLLI